MNAMSKSHNDPTSKPPGRTSKMEIVCLSTAILGTAFWAFFLFGGSIDAAKAAPDPASAMSVISPRQTVPYRQPGRPDPDVLGVIEITPPIYRFGAAHPQF
ncbi:hypothetical protein [Rhizobium sp. Root1220]|uniref:hypothetical protein n=1 Tax=Rhizobium sp. Root1220 TaxID=1736432 RepID=UPI000B009848|nr:hypothetical protein [Rhizobium sp. Root1220]